MTPYADDGVKETIAKEDIKPSNATELTFSKNERTIQRKIMEMVKQQ